ncbi:thiol S-methyltransferase TMT1B-like, partial [Panulirus ornatus]|uniref:thiol S-methyltransferase TMT1B-like n=1 Tax=Panulirus ornatus TaxID=150431 RepID=UPI003A8C30F2
NGIFLVSSQLDQLCESVLVLPRTFLKDPSTHGCTTSSNREIQTPLEFFAWLSSKAIEMKFNEYEEFKKELFVSLAKDNYNDPELQKDNAISILEIGVGIGSNFSYYPDGCRLVVVDPNPYFAKYYNENRAKFPNIKSEAIIVSTGEDMDMVESNSVDVVVTTLVLCSVSDIVKVISQVKRVLVPGGRYFFIEHIQEWDQRKHRIRYYLQNILTWFGIWSFFFDGCCLNRNPLPVINAVGFTDVSFEKLYAPVPVAFMTIVSPHLRGIATK